MSRHAQRGAPPTVQWSERAEGPWAAGPDPGGTGGARTGANGRRESAMSGQGTGSSPRLLRIGLVCPANVGGTATLVATLATELGHRGHQGHVIAHRTPLPLLHAWPGVRAHAVDVPLHPALPHPPAAIALAVAIAGVAASEDLDVIHAHYAVPPAFSALVARPLLRPTRRLPVIATLQGTDVTQLGDTPGLQPAIAWALSAADAVTAVSLSLAREARARFALPRTPAVLPNFVDARACRRRFDPTLRARLAGPEDLVVVHAYNFRPVKRVDDVLRVFARVAAFRPATLLLLGDGPEKAAAAHLSRVLGVAERVRFLGVQEDVVPFLSVADVCLMPPETEGCSLAVLEAMACRVPVVASRVGGLPEAVADGRTGFLCPMGDVPAMAAVCLRLADPNLRRALGEAARRVIARRFSADRVVPAYEQLYRAVLRPEEP